MMTQQSRIGAVVLAGGNVPSTLTPYCTYRALLRIHGRLLLDYLLQALSRTPSVVESVIVAPQAALGELAALPGLKVEAGQSLVENMMLGARALDDCRPDHLLFVTGDIPLVTPEGLEAFISDSVASGASLTYPIIPREVSEQRFPGARRTYVRLKEGTFTGGNAIFTQMHLLDEQQVLIQRLYSARKDPLRLAGILGLGTIFHLVTGTCTLPYLEAVAHRILGAPVRAIISRTAEIGFDVDKADDLAAVENAVAGAV